MSEDALDANGNTQTMVNSSGTTTYSWDYENRLTSVVLPGSGGTVSFKYDPFGRRIYKSSSSGTSVYTYDGDNLIEETNSSGGVVARYSQGLNIDEPLAELRSGTTSYYQADGLGSVTTLSNSAGAIAANYTYDSFGNLVASSGSIVNNFRYTGREWDSETSLYYYRARYYDPLAGRFLSEDPIGFFGGMSFYVYTLNNPVKFTDKFGLAAGVDDLILGVGGALVGVGVQAASDAVSGHLSDWQHYTGAAVGGAIGGLAIEYSGGVLTGALAGTTTNAVTQALEMLSGKQCAKFNYLSNVVDTGLGALGGALPELKVPVLSAGRNSFNAIAKTIRTKLANGTIGGVQAATAAKALFGSNVAGSAGIVFGVGSSALGGGDAAAEAMGGNPCGCKP